MPKIVDHNLRKKQIAEASWRVILEQGMEGATVRNIAKEAGLSLGALRHYFSTQDELLEFAMKLVMERATDRIEKIAVKELPPKDMILKILMQLVPTNPETLAEMEVWFTFISYARHKQVNMDLPHDRIYQGMTKLIRSMDQLKLLRKDLNIDLEIERLYALVDGVAIHALMEKERMNQERIYELFVYHLNSIWVEEQ
ncbi:TetR/AcrR family transcriptional regulator [Salinimicrobium sp. MT39]|uniref:TetR/AcrR family transcriptional regulator n=1 Tax=Salinimicrobium profundisediminis TaxID=2994553 RepID=A0A9X3I2P1_9FLAO|nr:TetR/AcrR family transcriptional regulator [Salinimicrobium profundisediminis]